MSFISVYAYQKTIKRSENINLQDSNLVNEYEWDSRVFNNKQYKWKILKRS